MHDNDDIYILMIKSNRQGVLGLVRSMGRELPSFKKYHCLLHLSHRIAFCLVSWFVRGYFIRYVKTILNMFLLIVREKVRMVGISPLFVNTELVGHDHHDDYDDHDDYNDHDQLHDLGQHYRHDDHIYHQFIISTILIKIIKTTKAPE